MAARPNVSEALSRRALLYQQAERTGSNVQRLHQKVQQAIERWAKPGGNVLVLNCGFGVDALELAQSGFTVCALDTNPSFVERLQQEAHRRGLQKQLRAELGDFSQLSTVETRFDAVVSNHGAINVYPDPRVVIRHITPFLNPTAMVTWAVMPPVCPWEIAAWPKLGLRQAARRLAPGGTCANMEGVRFTEYYFTPRQIRECFSPAFELVHLESFGLFTPPTQQKALPWKHKKLFRVLAKLEDRLTSLPVLRAMGDYYIITFKSSAPLQP